MISYHVYINCVFPPKRTIPVFMNSVVNFLRYVQNAEVYISWTKLSDEIMPHSDKLCILPKRTISVFMNSVEIYFRFVEIAIGAEQFILVEAK